jgi:hypothetical protein
VSISTAISSLNALDQATQEIKSSARTSDEATLLVGKHFIAAPFSHHRNQAWF